MFRPVVSTSKWLFSKLMPLGLSLILLTVSACDFKAKNKESIRKNGRGNNKVRALQSPQPNSNATANAKTKGLKSRGGLKSPSPSAPPNPSENDPFAANQDPSLNDGTPRSTSQKRKSGISGLKNQKGSVPQDPTNQENQTQGSEVELEQLQTILKSLSNIYLNAWYTINKDKSSRPKTFFEDIAMKLQNFQPITTIQEGQRPPASIQKNCDRHHLIQTIKAQTGYRNLHLYDCSGKNYTYLMSFRVSGNQWTLGTTPQGLEAVLPNNLGYLSTITFKPRCQVTLRSDGDEVKIAKADCRQWGQQSSSASGKERKTLLINSFLYDYQGDNVLTTEAQYIDYDGNNQLCRTGFMKRKAPNSNEFIYVEDDENQECKSDTPSAPNSGQALNGQALKGQPPLESNPRAQALPHPNSVSITQPETSSGPAQFWPGRFGNGAPPRRPLANGQTPRPSRPPLAPSELDQDPRQGQVLPVLDDQGLSENANDPSITNDSENLTPENSTPEDDSAYLGEEQ